MLIALSSLRTSVQASNLSIVIAVQMTERKTLTEGARFAPRKTVGRKIHGNKTLARWRAADLLRWGQEQARKWQEALRTDSTFYFERCEQFYTRKRILLYLLLVRNRSLTGPNRLLNASKTFYLEGILSRMAFMSLVVIIEIHKGHLMPRRVLK